MKVTQKQIADLIGVDRSTVSYVLCGRRRGGKISDEVAERIREVASDLGYVPNQPARALVSGKTSTVALLVPRNNQQKFSMVWSLVAEGAERRLFDSNYDVLLRQIETPSISEHNDLLRQRRADAVIYLGGSMRYDASSLSAFDLAPPTFIDLGQRCPCPRVCQNPRTGLREVFEALYGLGHRRFLWLEPEMATPFPRTGRLTTLSELASESGVSLEVLRFPFHPDGLMRPTDQVVGEVAGLLGRILPSSLSSTAALCWNDQFAHALLKVLSERGVAVPAEMSVVGFDDIGAEWARPPLSTVSGVFYEMGVAAGDLVVKILGGELSFSAALEAGVSAPTRFLPRASHGPPPGSG